MDNIERQKYDVSTKEYEVLACQYVFWKKTRENTITTPYSNSKIRWMTTNRGWYHYKYYKTLERAEQAVKKLRSVAKSDIGDYIFCYRYKAVRRWEYKEREEKLKRILDESNC